MLKILKYSLFDMMRNRWMFVYMGFFMIVTFALLLLSPDLSKVIITLTNVILALTPLIGILFGTMYFYNSREFIELLLSQPMSRRSIITGLYLGMAASLSISLIAGVAFPMILFGVLWSHELLSLLILLSMAVVLSVIFSIIAFIIALKNENKIKGLGLAIFFWLFFLIIYDGIFLLILLLFKDYPLENITLFMTILNPVDLARILILLKMDMSAMMGYTGAVLQKFLGSSMGSYTILASLTLWVIIPFSIMVKYTRKKNF